MSGICHDVGIIEPRLQPVTGEKFEQKTANREDGARLDIVAQDFRGRDRQRAFFDVRVFNPYAPCYQNSTLAQCYRKNELEKKRAYEERVREINMALLPQWWCLLLQEVWVPLQQLYTKG